MSENPSRYYAAELEERLVTVTELPNEEFMTPSLVLQLAVVTLALPLLALLIGWFTL